MASSSCIIRKVTSRESGANMPKAIWNGQVLAESDHTVMVEGNHYFPPETINRQFFTESDAHTLPLEGHG